MADKTARLTKNDAPRWMAVKDGMDHGPFTARELIKLIVDGEILEQHLVFTLSSPERKPLASYSEFADFIQQYKIRKDEKDHGEALAHSNKMEKRSTAAKALILSASIGAVGSARGLARVVRRPPCGAGARWSATARPRRPGGVGCLRTTVCAWRRSCATTA